MKAFAASEWDRAGRTLRTARQIVETDADSAASWAYYAAFHAASAMFALRGQAFRKHPAIRAAPHRDLVRPGLLATQAGEDYDFLAALRHTGDDGGEQRVSPADAREAVEKAGAFISAVAAACPELKAAGGS